MRVLKSVIVLLLLGSQPCIAVEHKLTWRAGWDDVHKKLDYEHSFVTYDESAPGKLIITYHLQGATPKKAYEVGVHVGFGQRCPATFGQFKAALKCRTFSRQESRARVVAFRLGTITTDDSGNGDLTIEVSHIAPGDYKLIFHVRAGNKCGSGGSCKVIFQAPGPFGSGTIELKVAPSR